MNAQQAKELTKPVEPAVRLYYESAAENLLWLTLQQDVVKAFIKTGDSQSAIDFLQEQCNMSRLDAKAVVKNVKEEIEVDSGKI
jgi:hypothetical protein